MPSHRPESVGKAVQVALSEVLRTETKDPRLAYVMVTAVKMTPDLRTAKVYVSTLGDQEKQSDILQSLNRAMAFLRRAVAQRVQLRHAPELAFAFDESMAQGAHIEQLLDGLN